MIVDSHAHLTIDTVFPKLDELVQKAQAVNIEKIINICIGEESLKRALEIKDKHPHIFHAAATTPHDVDKEGDSFFPIVEQNLKHLIAIGETGLDYYYKHSPIELQKKYLIKYLHLAIKAKLPVIIHCRDAFDDFFEILDKEYISSSNCGGVLHCFTGTLSEAKKVLDRNWYLSLSGIVTFKNSHELREVASLTPINQLLIETDTPYLAPQTKRGKINEPSFITETAKVIATCKGLSYEELCRQTANNAKNLFKLQ